jgi:hypothetical protein
MLFDGTRIGSITLGSPGRLVVSTFVGLEGPLHPTAEEEAEAYLFVNRQRLDVASEDLLQGAKPVLPLQGIIQVPAGPARIEEAVLLPGSASGPPVFVRPVSAVAIELPAA